MKPVVKFVPPHMDKNWSWQIYNADEEMIDTILLHIHFPEVKKYNPFIQGKDIAHGWLMVEFWSKEKPTEAANFLTEALGLQMTEGDFTREDLGL